MRKYLITGILVWIPVVITLWVLKLLVDTADQTLLLLPASWQPERLIGIKIMGLGVLLTFLIVLGTGVLAANILGRKVLDGWHRLLARIPVVRSIYGGVKQVSDILFSPDGNAFRKAVLIRYPHAGTWTVALVTGVPEGEVADHLGPDHVAVFVPTTPNITAGFFLLLPRSEVIELEMGVDVALKYIISMGAAEPPRKPKNGAEIKQSGTDPDPAPLLPTKR
jgi:uncharacterized membrane protein